ncbi:MAG: carboxymuconolactone decarboxylase family protein [Gemmatimonadetes bacterium]|nr:carboxymuconolactone decarboxylase family protein [Gemmatimonadota bacterium]
MSPDARSHDIVMPSGDILALVRFAARVANGPEAGMRAGATECVSAGTPVPWVEEMLLQSYLFCGFPRTLNAMREWRRVSGAPAPIEDSGAVGGGPGAWQEAGAATCEIVYGPFYEKLRHNIVALHPALDAWMIAEGYGKILSRPGLALRIREQCVVAACIASEQDRQLHSHLHGALNAGVPAAELRGTLEALEGVVPGPALERARLLLDRVVGK